MAAPMRMPTFALLFYAVLFLSGCRQKSVTIAVIPRTCGTWLWEAEHTGVSRAAPRYGLNVYWNAPTRENDVQGQIDILAQQLDRKVRGVILSPVETLPLRSPTQEALRRGTPVVVVGTNLGLTPGKNLAYVLNNEQMGGQLAARRMGKILHGRGEIAILGINQQLSSSTERFLSLESTLAQEFPQIHVVFRSLARQAIPDEQQVAERFLSKCHSIDGIIALSEISTRGAFYALTEFNRTKSIYLIGFDQTILAPIRIGDIDSVIIQNTYRMGESAMRTMDEELHGGAKQNYEVIPPLLVTRETIDTEAVREALDIYWFQS